MRDKEADRIRIQHMLDAIHAIRSFSPAELTEELLKDDLKLRSAVVMQLAIIGEAAKAVSEDLKEKTSLIPWRDIQSMRNRLIHEYFGISLEIVVHVVVRQLPDLEERLNDLLQY
jgi:uncharacterized protein with HEPN domain